MPCKLEQQRNDVDKPEGKGQNGNIKRILGDVNYNDLAVK